MEESRDVVLTKRNVRLGSIDGRDGNEEDGGSGVLLFSWVSKLWYFAV